MTLKEWRSERRERKRTHRILERNPDYDFIVLRPGRGFSAGAGQRIRVDSGGVAMYSHYEVVARTEPGIFVRQFNHNLGRGAHRELPYKVEREECDFKYFDLRTSKGSVREWHNFYDCSVGSAIPIDSRQAGRIVPAPSHQCSECVNLYRASVSEALREAGLPPN